MIEVIKKSKNEEVDEKSCYTCRYCQASVSWWCVNKDAIKLNQSKIPSGLCGFWKEMRNIKDLTFLEKTFKDFIYV